MATSVISRPAKELEDGFFSRWNSITLPVIYQFTNNKFPINTFDTAFTISSVFYDGSRGGTVIEFGGTNDLVPLDKVSLKDIGIVGLDNEVHSIIQSETGPNSVVIDFFTDETSTTGSMIKFYNNYKVLVKVVKGAPLQHPYELDGTKVLEEVGTLEVDFIRKDGENFGVVDIHTLAGLGTNSDFDYQDENSRTSWNAFIIEFAESHDQSDGNEINTFVGEFIFDTLEGCTAEIGFVDPGFDDGLDFWLQEVFGTPSVSFITGVGIVSVTIPNIERSEMLYQNIPLIGGTSYTIQVDLDFVSAAGGTTLNMQIYAFDGTDWIFQHEESITTLGIKNFSFAIIPGANMQRLGLQIVGFAATDTSLVEIDFFDLEFTTVQFINDQFDNGLDDWDVSNIPTNNNSLWITGVGEITSSFTQGMAAPNATELLSQDVPLSVGISYKFTVDITLTGSFTNTILKIIGTDFVEIESLTVTTSGVYEIIATPLSSVSGVGLSVGPNALQDESINITLNSFTIEYETDVQCLAVLFGAYGTNQFQNQLGGNFGDFVAHNENALFMTVFDEYRYFFDSPFYASIIITEALFSASIDVNSIFLQIDFLDNTGASLGILLHQVESKKEGGYHIAPDIAAFLELEGIGKNDWKTAEMILIQQTDEPAINQISQLKILNNSLSCAPSFSPVPMRFLNASGGWDTWTWQQLKVLDEVRTKNVIVKRDILSDFDNIFINGDTQYQSVKIDSRKTLLLRSLTLTEEELFGLSQLCNSVRAQIFINGRWVTVSVDTNAMNIFNEEAKIRTLTMSVRLPDTLNQTS